MSMYLLLGTHVHCLGLHRRQVRHVTLLRGQLSLKNLEVQAAHRHTSLPGTRGLCVLHTHAAHGIRKARLATLVPSTDMERTGGRAILLTACATQTTQRSATPGGGPAAIGLARQGQAGWQDRARRPMPGSTRRRRYEDASCALMQPTNLPATEGRG